MSIHAPHLAKIAEISRLAGIAPADPLILPLEQARIQARAYQSVWNTPLPEIGAVATAQVTAPRGNTVSLRIHYPDHRRDSVPALLYFHGGGFALNGVDTHERLMRLLALRSSAAVVGVGYSLAPELRFPGQLEEALAALTWLRRAGHQYGLDGEAVAVGGDSAGANLALALTLTLRNAGQPLPRLGLLLYGMFSADLTSPSHLAYGGGAFGLPTARVDWFWDQYLSDPRQRDHPLAAPLLADLAGLPPQLVIGAGLDCLLDDSLNLARRLEQADVEHTLSVYDGVPHSFMQMSAHLAPADAAISEAAAALHRHLAISPRLAAE